MELRITQTYAKIGITSHPSQLSIRQPPPRYTMEGEDARLEFRTKPGRLLIDQSRCFAEAGLKTVFDLTREYAQKGREDALEAVGQMAEEGDRMMAIENGENVIPQLAQERADREYETNITFIPSSRPDIRVEEGRVDAEYIPATRKIDWEVHTRPVIDATRGSVEIYMRQWPGINIEVVGQNIDRRV